jgi:hypothetical protein
MWGGQPVEYVHAELRILTFKQMLGRVKPGRPGSYYRRRYNSLFVAALIRRVVPFLPFARRPASDFPPRAGFIPLLLLTRPLSQLYFYSGIMHPGF